MLRLPTMFTNMTMARLVLTRFRPNLTLNPKTLRPLTASNTAFNQEQRREFKNFGHKPDPVPAFSKFYYAFIGLSIVGLTLNWKGIKKFIFPAVEAKAKVVKDSEVLKDEGNEFPKEEKLKDEGNEFVKDETVQDGSINEKCISDTSKDDLKKGKAGFRERKIIEYENRMRSYSTPDKIFRYFATVRMAQDNSAEIYMTPDDFLRAITPGERQPDGLGLDQFRKYDPKNIQVCMNLALEPDSIFYKLGSAGLITFSDYIFLLTVLSTSRRHFEIAFRMFDLNGDGDVDCEEFEKVATLVRSQTSIGSRHRDHANTGNTFKGVNSALTTYFFGPEKDRKLTITRFLDFQTQLQREILTLEFKRKEPNEEGKISELAFAELLVAYAGYLPKKKAKLMKRVKKTFRDHGQGISKQDYLDFFHFLNNINDVDTALTFYHIAGAAIDQATLKHVARTVAQVELSDHVINVVYTIFDEDGDNQLSNKEFVSVMKNRLLRGLEKPKDIGFVKFIQSFIKCAKVAKPAILDI